VADDARAPLGSSVKQFAYHSSCSAIDGRPTAATSSSSGPPRIKHKLCPSAAEVNGVPFRGVYLGIRLCPGSDTSLLEACCATERLHSEEGSAHITRYACGTVTNRVRHRSQRVSGRTTMLGRTSATFRTFVFINCLLSATSLRQRSWGPQLHDTFDQRRPSPEVRE